MYFVEIMHLECNHAWDATDHCSCISNIHLIKCFSVWNHKWKWHRAFFGIVIFKICILNHISKFLVIFLKPKWLSITLNVTKVIYHFMSKNSSSFLNKAPLSPNSFYKWLTLVSWALTYLWLKNVTTRNRSRLLLRT